MLGCTRGNAIHLTNQQGFPERAYQLTGVALWRTEDVTDWAVTKGRDVMLPREAQYDTPPAGRILNP